MGRDAGDSVSGASRARSRRSVARQHFGPYHPKALLSFSSLPKLFIPPRSARPFLMPCQRLRRLSWLQVLIAQDLLL